MVSLSSMILKIYLLRHGQTLLNKLDKNQGWINSDLTDMAIEQLNEKYNKSSNFPTFDAVYCSDLGRAAQTLEIIQPFLSLSNKADINYSKNLRERFLGSFEGDNLQENRFYLSKKEGFNSFEDFIKQHSFWDFIDTTKKFDPLHLAESYNDFSTRIDDTLEEIISTARDQKHNNILIVSHANPVRYIIEKLKKTNYPHPILNSEILVISIDLTQINH